MSQSAPLSESGPLAPPGAPALPGPAGHDAGDAGRRHAILIDAGYLYASVGLLVLGTTSRRAFRVAAESLIDALIALAAGRVPGELLRMYWYDAARDRVPTVEQRQIATLPHVKVRLGNLNSAGQQKGVDAQIRQDLETLARHRAVSDVVLLAGDEDMVPAVEAAQAYGVRVHVWGVEPPYGVNQAERLIWEADTVDRLGVDFWRPHLEPEGEADLPVGAGAAVPTGLPPGRAGPERDGDGAAVDGAAVDGATVDGTPANGATVDGTPANGSAGGADDRPLVPTPADVFAGRRPAPPPHGQPHPHPPHQQPTRLGPDRAAMEEIGSRIASRWLLTRGRDNVADLLPGPVLPTVIDKELLVEAEEEISRSLRPYEDARRALRDGFWARLHKEFGLSVGVAPEQLGTPPPPTPPAAEAAAPPAATAAPPAATAAPPAVDGAADGSGPAPGAVLPALD